jgi:hypothetical protein
VAPPVLVPNSSDPARERARGRAVALHGRGSVVQMWTMGSSLRGCLNFRRPYRRAAGSLFSPHDRVYGFARPFPRATRDALTKHNMVHIFHTIDILEVSFITKEGISKQDSFSSWSFWFFYGQFLYCRYLIWINRNRQLF